jgi:hypothetical protein
MYFLVIGYKQECKSYVNDNWRLNIFFPNFFFLKAKKWYNI